MRAPNCSASISTIDPPRRYAPSRRSPHPPPGAQPMKPMMPTAQLINELQSFGMRLVDPKAGADSRRGGAGPSDHKAITIDGMTVMAPVHTAPAFESPYLMERPDGNGRSRIMRDGAFIGEATFPLQPRFYALKTADGIPYSKIAVL